MIIHTDFNLKPCNTFGISAIAKELYIARNAAEISKLAQNGFFHISNFPLVLGGGSNVLLIREEFDKVLKIEIEGIEVVESNKESTIVKAGAGVNWQSLIDFSLKHGLYGIENLTLIPGTCGAAPMQNIGAYGTEISDVFDSLEAIDLFTGKKEIFRISDCAFGYRQSIFKNALKNKYIISSICLRLSNHFTPVLSYGALTQRLAEKGINSPKAHEISQMVAAIRMEKLPDPTLQGNAGSFFKNPVIEMKHYEDIKQSFPEIPAYIQKEGNVKIPAAWLIERTGLKGFQKGKARVHDRQALVLVNAGNASGAEILELSQLVAEKVLSTFSIRLEPEVNIV